MCNLYSQRYLALESQAGANLVASLVELVRVERQTQTEGGAAVDLGVVGQSCDSAVVDFDLDCQFSRTVSIYTTDRIRTFANDTGSSLYLLASSRPTSLRDCRS